MAVDRLQHLRVLVKKIHFQLSYFSCQRNGAIYDQTVIILFPAATQAQKGDHLYLNR